MKIILLLFLFLNFAICENLPSINKNKIYENIMPSDEINYEDAILEEQFTPNSALVLNANNYKDSYYIDEVFSIELMAKTNENINFEFTIEPIKSEDLLFLNKSIKWKFDNGYYKTNLYFQAKSSNAFLDKIIVKLNRNKKIFQEESIKINPINFIKINYNKNYSHIVAKQLNIKKIKTSKFNEDDIIMMIELEAIDANLKSFFIKNIKKQGIENLRGDFNNSNAYYYAILPKTTQNFDFSYFNLDKNELENINFKINISEDSISTQSDLNPKSKNFNIYKLIAIWSLSFILALIFVFKKSYILLGISLIFFIIGFLIDTSYNLATLKPNSKIKILPTTQSVYFYTSKNYEKVEILNKRKNYVKILLENGKIGWVDNANLQKN